MSPHQERVVQERAELAEKLEKLDAFLSDKSRLATLDLQDVSLLCHQGDIMQQYVAVLDKRIARFA